MHSPSLPDNSPVKPGVVSSAFLLLGGAFFLLFCAELLMVPEWFVTGARDAGMAAVLHAAVLGWLLSVGFGVVYLLLSALRATRRGEGLAGRVHFLCHLTALGLLLPAFARWDLALVAHAGTLMLVGFLIFGTLCTGSLEKGRRLPMVQVTIVSSLTWLFLTLILGILAAANYYWTFLPMGTLRAVHAGMHAGFGGYVVLLLVGLSYPLFQAEARGSMERRLWVFLLCNSGLYLSVLGIAFSLPVLLPAVLLILAGLVLYLMEAMVGLQLRHGPADAWVWGLLAGFLSILLLMGLGLALGLSSSQTPVALGRLENLYGFLWITIATGLPLWAVAGRMLQPRAGNRRRTRITLFFYVTAALVGGWGIFIGSPRGVRVGGLLLLLGGGDLLLTLLPGLWTALSGRVSRTEDDRKAAVETANERLGPPIVVWAILVAVVAWILAGLLPHSGAHRPRVISVEKSVSMNGDGPACPVRRWIGLKNDSLARGKNLYGQHCATCHGTTGAGDGSAAIYLYPKPRNFTAGQFKLRSTASGMPTDEDLYRVMSAGMSGSSMPSFAHLSEQSRRDLVEYVKRLSQAEENGRMVNWFKETPPGSSLPTPRKPEFTPELAAAGKRVYQSQDCKRCHGPEGRGDGPEAATLKDSWGGRLRPRSLVQDPFLGGDAAESIFLRTATGIGGTPMTAYPDTQIKPEDRWALVAYIRSLRQQAGTLDEGAPSASPVAEPVARHLKGALPSSPSDPSWDALPVALVAVNPVWRTTQPTRHAALRAAHDGKDLALLLEWSNPEPVLGGGRVQDYTDRAALQFSLHASPGFLGMGDPFRPVNLWQWSCRRRATSQGPQALMMDIYPEKKADLYPDGRKLVYSAEMAGNLVAEEGVDAIEDANAQGPGTLALQSAADQNVIGASAWSEGKWRVLFRRSLVPKGRADVDLAPGHRVPVAIAIWDGRTRDRNGQKNVSAWHFLTLEP
ncbi:MAG: c-type cytochrome [Verrucomicrobiae bacterium]|nr:c-type cytochrome [Verrucomicrobiae bacterium]